MAAADGRSSREAIDAAKILINASVMLRLDYRNGLQDRILQRQRDRLQSIFKDAAQLIFRSITFFCACDTASSNRLHWLRCPEMIQYKVCVV